MPVSATRSELLKKRVDSSPACSRRSKRATSGRYTRPASPRDACESSCRCCNSSAAAAQAGRRLRKVTRSTRHRSRARRAAHPDRRAACVRPPRQRRPWTGWRPRVEEPRPGAQAVVGAVSDRDDGAPGAQARPHRRGSAGGRARLVENRRFAAGAGRSMRAWPNARRGSRRQWPRPARCTCPSGCTPCGSRRRSCATPWSSRPRPRAGVAGRTCGC